MTDGLQGPEEDMIIKNSHSDLYRNCPGEGKDDNDNSDSDCYDENDEDTFWGEEPLSKHLVRLAKIPPLLKIIHNYPPVSLHRLNTLHTSHTKSYNVRTYDTAPEEKPKEQPDYRIQRVV